MPSTTNADRSEQPSSLEEANLPLEHAARLLAIADGICAIGQLRTGERAGQFSLFNFLIRCTVDDDYSSPDERTAYVLLMQAGIIRRHGWYAHFWRADDEHRLRLALPAPISTSWHWHDDLIEISSRFETSEAWTQAVGCSVDEHVQRYQHLLAEAEVFRATTA